MKKVLVANRGEVAVRIIRACADAGLKSVAVYADSDAESLPVQLADEAWALKGNTPADTYLRIDKLLSIAKRSGADAVHPGYGFLSENPIFAEAVISAGLTWIGPSPETMRLLGDKLSARAVAREVGAPLAPGMDHPLTDLREGHEFIAKVGLPVAIKAANGGGGRGMRVVRDEKDFDEMVHSAKTEAQVAFGDDQVYLERFLDKPRHVEVQIAADKFGKTVAIGTRDCSLQRRNQKLVEEAPAPFLPEETRQRLQNAAKAIVAKAGYVGIGTVEFLVAEDGTMTFLEVNTRLQVEHGVTEQVYMVDLVLEQFNLAEGGALTIDDDPEPRGHAIEFRLVAEDPGTGFMPSAGQIDWLRLPAGPGVRVDAGIFPGSVVSVYFDSMLAKLVFRGKDREECLQRARRGLKETVISGVSTSLEFDRKILDQPAFCAPNGHLGIYTTWVESEFLPFWKPESSYVSGSEQASLTRFVIEVDGRRVILGLPRMILAGLGNLDEGVEHLELVDQSPALVHAPIAGTIGRLDVSEGDHVEAGQEIAIIEALKMGLSVYAPRAGVVGPWKVAVGTRVEADDELVMIA